MDSSAPEPPVEQPVVPATTATPDHLSAAEADALAERFKPSWESFDTPSGAPDPETEAATPAAPPAHVGEAIGLPPHGAQFPEAAPQPSPAAHSVPMADETAQLAAAVLPKSGMNLIVLLGGTVSLAVIAVVIGAMIMSGGAEPEDAQPRLEPESRESARDTVPPAGVGEEVAGQPAATPAEASPVEAPSEAADPPPVPAPEVEAEAGADPEPGSAGVEGDVATTPNTEVAEAGAAETPAPAHDNADAVEPVTPPVAEEPTMVRLRVTTVPTDATLRLDGRRVDNPLDEQVEIGGSHRVVATADGFERRVQEVRFDRDRQIVIELSPRPSTRARRPGRARRTGTGGQTRMRATMSPMRAPSMSGTRGSGFVTDNPY